MRLHSLQALCLAFAVVAPWNASAQALAVGRFDKAQVDAGWVLRGSASPTVKAGGDPEGSGWLRLTDASFNTVGSALFGGPPFSARNGIVLSFSYASWGGGTPGADGLSVFLFDAAADMSAAQSGGGLGYCQGSGGWLGLGLDEYGNFSNPADVCRSGPGQRPHHVVLRGPVAAGQPLVSEAPVPGNVDRPNEKQRPAAAQVFMELSPKGAGPGYTVSVDWRANPSGGWRRLVHEADFPFAAPEGLRVGAAASTGGAKNVHELRDLMVRPWFAPRIAQAFLPDIVRVGQPTTLVIRIVGAPGDSALLKPFQYVLPPAVKLSRPVQLGGTCRGELSIAPDGSSFTILEGSRFPAAGCTLTVGLVAESAGQWTVDIPRGGLTTDTGTNAVRAQGALAVSP